MKNPYVFGYLPFITIVLFSLTFGVFTVGASTDFFKEIGLYSGMREFLSDAQLRLFLLIIYALLFFMVFSALKLIAETIHNSGMLFFSKDVEGKSYSEARAGSVIYFFGAIATAGGIFSIQVMALIFLGSTLLYFIYTIYKLSQFMSIASMLGLIAFEVLLWGASVSGVAYIVIKLYSGILASIPIT